MKIETSIVIYMYIYSFLATVQIWFGIKKTTQRNYIQKKKKKDPVDRNRATFPRFLPFLLLRVREKRDLCGREFCPSLPTQSSSIVVYPRWRETRGSFELYSAHSASSDSIRQSMMGQKRRETGREKKIRRMKVQLGVRFSRLPGDHAYTRARTHLSMHRWFIDQESTLFYCSNPLSLHQPLHQSASRVCRCFCRLYTNLLLFLSAISTSTRYQKGPGITRNLSLSPRRRSIGCLSHSPKNHPSFMLFAR